MKKEDKVLYVIKCGARTPIGDDAGLSAASHLAGITRLTYHDEFESRGFKPVVVGMAGYLDYSLSGPARIIALARPALEEVLEPLLALETVKATVNLYLGLPEDRPGINEDLEKDLRIMVGELALEKKVRLIVEFIKQGHASAMTAMKLGQEELLNGETEFFIVGGVESWLDKKSIGWLEKNEQLKVNSNQWGIVPGEAAGFCLITNQKSVRKYKLLPTVKVLAFATAQEEKKTSVDSVCTGRRMIEVITQVLKPLKSVGEKIDQVYCSLTGERLQTEEYGFAMAKLSGHFSNPANLITLGRFMGDVGAASGPLLVNLVAENGNWEEPESPYNLIFCNSLGEHRAAALIELIR